MSIIDIKNFMYLVEVAETGSITKTAHKLYVSQPYLSRMIREIEEEFKINIFIRTNQGVMLTSEGEKFLNQTKLMLREYNKFSNLHINSNWPKKIFSISTVRSSLVVESFIRLVKEYESFEIEFSIRESGGIEPLQDIYLLNSDLGVIYIRSSKKEFFLEELKRRGVSYKKITTFNSCIIVRSGHPLTLKDHPLVIDDLIDYGLVKYDNAVLIYDDENTSYNLYDSIIQNKNIKNVVNISDRASFHNVLTQTDFFSIGTMAARNQEELFGIVSIPFDFQNEDYQMEMGIIHLKNNQLSSISKRFIQILMDTYS